MNELSLRTHSAALGTVSDLLTRQFANLSLHSLRELAKALQGSQPDAEALAEAVASVATSAGDGLPPRVLKGGGIGEIVSLNEGSAAIDALAVNDESTDWAASDLLGAGETAARIGVARTSLDNWRRVHRVLAFRRGVRNFVYPMRQFERQRPLDGIERIRAHFPNDEETWAWLVEKNPNTGDIEPIERLRKGKVEEVARAAEGAFDYQ